MTYQEFLRRVQDQGGLSSSDETARVVTATLETLRDCLAGGGIDALPEEIRRLVPAQLAGAGQGLGGVATTQTENPQVIGETRAASGGESTAESGQ